MNSRVKNRKKLMNINEIKTSIGSFLGPYLGKPYYTLMKLLRIQLGLPIDYDGNEANSYIKQLLESNKPCMIARFGETELRTCVAYINKKNGIKFGIKNFLRRESFTWDERIKHRMFALAGLTPATPETLDFFSKKLIEDMKLVDILGSWITFEERVQPYLPSAKFIPLNDLDPWKHKSPWTTALKEKKVLVIHPFEKTIKQQYKRRNLLFNNESVLPEFELITMKPFFPLMDTNYKYNSWFESLDDMCKKISKINFDIAIIAAGPYGFHIAAHIKRTGKKAVHLGGVTQLLFGIKGKRWDNTDVEKKLYNKHWIRPLASDTPKNSQKIENKCYW
ncbi:MAG TPA: hypothetical protein QF753_10120 [Victivallales bacterium]|nr:hypothetical protein [Victivallales bacterium]